MSTLCGWTPFLEANSQASLLGSVQEAEIHPPFAALFLPFQLISGLDTVPGSRQAHLLFWQHLHFALPKTLLTHHLPSQSCAFKGGGTDRSARPGSIELKARDLI